MSHVRRFDHVGLTVADFDVVTAFFVTLGLEIEDRRGAPVTRDLALQANSHSAHLDFLSAADDCFLNSREADPLLFESDGRSVSVRDEVGVEGRFDRA